MYNFLDRDQSQKEEEKKEKEETQEISLQCKAIFPKRRQSQEFSVEAVAAAVVAAAAVFAAAATATAVIVEVVVIRHPSTLYYSYNYRALQPDRIFCSFKTSKSADRRF